jgi:hypothetical protein
MAGIGGGAGVVLFGGYTFNGIFNDTWSFDGAAWRRASGVAPSARSFHAMAALNGSVVLFGGTGTGTSTFGDTWTFDGTAWQQWIGSGPPAVFRHAMATLQ